MKVEVAILGSLSLIKSYGFCERKAVFEEEQWVMCSYESTLVARLILYPLTH